MFLNACLCRTQRLPGIALGLLVVAATIALADGVAIAAEVKAGDLTISRAYSWQPMNDAMAGFLTIANAGASDDTLVSATASITPTVQLHDMTMKDGVMKMVELTGGIPIPAGKTVELKPGSLHVMFVGVAKPPAAGSSFDGTLTFAKAGTVNVHYDVLMLGKQP